MVFQPSVLQLLLVKLAELTNPALLYACNNELRLSPRRTTAYPSLLYRVQILFESSGHAGDQVNVVVHAAAHAALHQ